MSRDDNTEEVKNHLILIRNGKLNASLLHCGLLSSFFLLRLSAVGIIYIQALYYVKVLFIWQIIMIKKVVKEKY